jgi:hypothetical protein
MGAIFDPAAIIAYPRDILPADDADRQRCQGLLPHILQEPLLYNSNIFRLILYQQSAVCTYILESGKFALTWAGATN